MLRRHPSSTLFPYTTLFRSVVFSNYPYIEPRGYVCYRARTPIVIDGKLEDAAWQAAPRSEEHTSELQSRFDLVCRLLLEKKNTPTNDRLCVLHNIGIHANTN